MRAKGRKQGRFVALSGLKKLTSPPNSPYPLLIVDARGFPVFPLCEWYRRKKEFDPGRTPDTYLDMVAPYFGFLLSKQYAWNDPPQQVRTYLVEFLRQDVGCLVGPMQESDGYFVETTGASPLSKSSLGVLLAALTSLYDILSSAGYYPYQNPMRSERLIALKQEHLRQVKNTRAPDHAGIRSESRQETNQAYPTTFFRQKRGRVWEPQMVMEPESVQERMRQTIDFMIKLAPFQRDKIILLLLRQTGARLSEIVEMRIGGYRQASHAGQALVKNKGSHGREEKLIYFSDVIEEQLLRYVRTERAEHDPQGRKLLDQLDDGDALFLTEDGKPYTRSTFYFHWYRLLEAAQKRFKKQEQVSFSPHDLRHLHVTHNISKIRAKANGDKELEEDLLTGFSQLMGWRSRQTMDTYTHVLNKRQALLEIVLAEDDDMWPRTAEYNHAASVIVTDRTTPHQECSLPAELPASSTAVSAPLKDDMSWYEE